MGGSTEKRHFDVSRGTISMDGFPKLFLIRIYFEAEKTAQMRQSIQEWAK